MAGVGDLEPALRGLDELQEELVGREVAFPGHLFHDRPVEALVEVVVPEPDIQDRVGPEPKGLVDLEVEDDMEHQSTSSR
jgi:hypothetical protein